MLFVFSLRFKVRVALIKDQEAGLGRQQLVDTALLPELFENTIYWWKLDAELNRYFFLMHVEGQMLVDYVDPFAQAQLL